MNTGKQVNIMVILIFLTLIALGGYTLWDPFRADEAEEEQGEKAAERGAFLFAQNCRICHGDSGEGGAIGGRLPQAPPLARTDLQGFVETELRLAADVTTSDTAITLDGEAIFDSGDILLVDDEKMEVKEVEENLVQVGRAFGATEAASHAADAKVLVLNEAMLDQQFALVRGTIACGRVGTAMPLWAESEGGSLNEEQIRQLTLLITTGAWDEAAHFAEEIDATGIELEAPGGLSAEETALTLSSVEGFIAGSLIRIDEERMAIEEVREEENQIVVERGVRATQPEEHEDGAEVFNQPLPPEPPSINTAACGQVAREVSTPAEATPEATPEGTPGATPEATPAEELPGKDVFLGAAGCSACHTIEGVSTGTVGPELTQIGTVAGTRIEGLSAEEYIRESIEDPGAFVAPGFPNAMPPGLRDVLSDEEFEQLIEYLLSLE